MKIMLCQINPLVGDIKGNLQLLFNDISNANEEKCDVVVFPELCLTGYPPRDLLYKQSIWQSHQRAVQKITDFVKTFNRQITVIFGGLHENLGTYGRSERYNAAFIIDRKTTRIVYKRLLPCYDVFDETRYFKSGINEPYIPIPIIVGDINPYVVPCDVIICEDMWNHRFGDTNHLLPATYTENPISQLKGSGPIFILNGSPFWRGKIQRTIQIVEGIAYDTHRPVCWVNQMGAHDDIITGGYSMIALPARTTNALLPNYVQISVGKAFETDRIVFDLADHPKQEDKLPDYPRLMFSESNSYLCMDHPALNGQKIDLSDFDCWANYEALKLYLRDYCRKTSFTDVVLGLSGGIDSALVCSIAVDALGPEHVHAVTMPSKFSSQGSVSDSEQLAKNLGIELQNISITRIHNAVRNIIGSVSSLTDENIQPRCRMLILMALSNENNWLLLTTGNKSELSVGYCTLYGDMAGGLSVIGDLMKTEVFKMCHMINRYWPERIPEAILTKPPSAELRDGQVDSETLPEYDLLDPLLEDIMMDLPIDEIMRRTTIPERVVEIIHKVERNEYKREQLPKNPKLCARSFGSGRRMPIAAKYSTLEE